MKDMFCLYFPIFSRMSCKFSVMCKTLWSKGCKTEVTFNGKNTSFIHWLIHWQLSDEQDSYQSVISFLHDPVIFETNMIVIIVSYLGFIVKQSWFICIENITKYRLATLLLYHQSHHKFSHRLYPDELGNKNNSWNFSCLSGSFVFFRRTGPFIGTLFFL